MDSTTTIQEVVPHPLVRNEVRRILTQSPAYRSLPEATRRELAHDMAKVANYFTVGETGDNVPETAVLASPLAGPARNLISSTRNTGSSQRPRDPAGDTAGQRFAEGCAVAAQQGVASYTELVNKVDFPKFVAGLIDGVFNAIVKSSIKQMEAYANLLKNVAKSVDEYMRDNVTQNQARDYLADRYPDHLEVDISGDQPKLKPKEGHDEDNLPPFFQDLGLAQPVESLDEDTTEEVLVPAARRRMAMDRQQLLATMVLMGINRLVVTDGSIRASVLFELKTTDSVQRHYNQASQYDSQSSYTRSSSGWFSPDEESTSTSDFQVSTTRSEDSAAKVDLHAKLSGEVKVNFKSETFPLERMADVLQINQIQDKVPARVAAGAGSTGNQPAQPAPAAPTQPGQVTTGNR